MSVVGPIRRMSTKMDRGGWTTFCAESYLNSISRFRSFWPTKCIFHISIHFDQLIICFQIFSSLSKFSPITIFFHKLLACLARLLKLTYFSKKYFWQEVVFVWFINLKSTFEQLLLFDQIFKKTFLVFFQKYFWKKCFWKKCFWKARKGWLSWLSKWFPT